MHYRVLAESLADEKHRLQKHDDKGELVGELEMDTDDWIRVLDILSEKEPRIGEILNG